MGVAGQDDDELQLQDDPSDPPNDDPADPPTGDDPQDPPAGGDEDEDVVQIGSEEPPASEETKAAPEWVKGLRQRQRELARENAELKAEKARLIGQPSTTQAPTLPAKPTLAEHDYDEEKFQAATDGWYAKKREVEAHEANQKNAVERAQAAQRQVHENYAKSKQALKVKDFQEVEDDVAGQFSMVQQSIVVAGTENPAAVVYALGKNPKKLAELASIKDPVKFAVAVGKLETEVKVTKRTSTKPAPESTLRGGSGSAPATSATLDRLRAEADKTGDRSKVAAYLRKNPGK